MIKIAVTGGIASGKSLVCQFLREQGAIFVSADEISHQLLKSNKKKIVELLGVEVVVDRELDRGKIAEIVFNDVTALKKLEAIIHPQVIEKIEELYQESDGHAFVVEAPLLFEIDFNSWFDYTIAVISSKSQCLKRLNEKGLTSSQYEKRQSRLLDRELVAKLADFTIVNDGTKEELKTKTQHTLKKVYETDGSGRAPNKA